MKFIVNKNGGVHSVTDEHAEVVLSQEGFREATSEEIAEWHKQQKLSVPQEFQKKAE